MLNRKRQFEAKNVQSHELSRGQERSLHDAPGHVIVKPPSVFGKRAMYAAVAYNSPWLVVVVLVRVGVRVRVLVLVVVLVMTVMLVK